MGNGDCGQLTTYCLCCSFLLMLFPYSRMGSLPWETILHKLLQHGSFPWGAVLLEQTVPVWVPYECHRSCQEPAPAWALPWNRRFLQGTSTYSGMGPSMGCRVDLCSTMGCRGTACLTRVFTMGCRGISVLEPGAPPTPPSPLTLLSAELLLSYIHSSLPAVVVQQFSPFLKYIITAVLPLLLIGLALATSGSV